MEHRTVDWMEGLSEEDETFLKRFVLASGSLKALAQEYAVSYPTIRLRLDRLIEKIRVYDRQQPSTQVERELRAAYADGKVDYATFKRLMRAMQRDQAERDRE
jgi:hypothetical protein